MTEEIIATEETIATRIRDYWRALGYEVDVGVQDITLQTRGSAHRYRAARANLINGLPHGYRDHTNVRLGI